MSYELRDKAGLTRHLRIDRATMAAARWFLGRSGPFVSTGATANVFLRTCEGLRRPDAQMIAIPLSNAAHLWWWGRSSPVYSLTARIGPLHPRSRGWVKLRSTDPRDPPKIRINMFTEQDDLATMIRAVRLCREIYAQAPLRDLIRREIAPGPAVQTDEQLGETIRREASHRAHPVGTCRMGHDALAVVDDRLRVHGLKELRIADAPIMPELPSGNTDLPAIMIGEKAAALIKADLGA